MAGGYPRQLIRQSSEGDLPWREIGSQAEDREIVLKPSRLVDLVTQKKGEKLFVHEALRIDRRLGAGGQELLHGLIDTPGGRPGIGIRSGVPIVAESGQENRDASKIRTTLFLKGSVVIRALRKQDAWEIGALPDISQEACLI